MKFIDTQTLSFDEAPRFRKTAELSIQCVTIAEGGEKVVTRHKNDDGTNFIETTKTAVQGDAIVQRDALDVYVIDKATFEDLYELHPDGERFVSRNSGRALFLHTDVEIDAPWGEKQTIHAGGVLFKNDLTGEVYGNQAHSFEGDFARELSDGTLLPLSIDLSEQRNLIAPDADRHHYADLISRENFHNRAASSLAKPSLVGSDVPWGGSYGQDRFDVEYSASRNKGPKI